MSSDGCAENVFVQAREALTQWVDFADRYWWTAPDRPELGCFGTGYDGWGVQTNQKYIGACATLLADPEYATDDSGKRSALLSRVIQALRFSLESHATGSYRCTDGKQWGLTGISPLGIERMMHGVDAIAPLLTDSDRNALKRVVVAECDNLLTYDICAGRWPPEGHNCPESNIWKGALLFRTARMFPNELHAADWIEKAHGFFVNGISVLADGKDGTFAGGKSVAERYVGANFFEHYALNHHGYLNVGYMVICISNIAMLHYGMAARNEAVPETAYHHVADLWALIRRLIFNDGRLCRIGGDSRQRYCYCQDYLLPSLLFASDHLHDSRAAALASRVIDLMLTEQRLNGDGGFLSRRLAHVAAQNVHYYARLESDKAIVLSMALEWNRQRTFTLAQDPQESSVEGGWAEPEHGAMFHRSSTRIASWSWRACLHESPQGLCLPPDDGHLAEWRMNLAGAVIPAAEQFGATTREERLVRHEQGSFDGGFLTCGELIDGGNVRIGEGWSAPETARHWIAFAALPDAHTVIRLELARLPARRVYLAGLEGVRMNVPNDLFNGMERRYAMEAGEWISRAVLGEDRVFEFPSSWINVEDRIGLVGIYGGGKWAVCCNGKRTGGYFGSILCDVLCFPYRKGFWDVNGPAIVLDTGCAIVSSADAARTREIAHSGAVTRMACDLPDVRIVRALGWDGRTYLLAANFSAAPQCVSIPSALSATDLVAGSVISAQRGRLTLDLRPGCRLLSFGR